MEHFELTMPQQNMWNLQKYYNKTAITNLCGAVFFQEKREDALLRRAVSRFITSQSGIRLRFNEEGEEPRQYVSEQIDEDIPIMTFRSMEEFDAYAENCARDPIGLVERKMYRFVVFHLQQEHKSGILAVLSHLISDAWTFGLLVNQLDAEYRRLAREGALTANSACPVPADLEHRYMPLIEGDYRDFIRSENAYFTSERYGKDKRYWDGKYPAHPEESPVKLRSVSSDSIEAKRIVRTLPPTLEQGITSYCGSHPVTEAVLFETALAVYLSHINPDIQTVTMGVPVLNRSNTREKEIAGMFVSTMPLTVVITKDTEIAELARQITKGHMDLFRHQKYPYGSILRQLREKQDFSGNLYDVMVSFQNAKTKTGADTKWYSNGYSEVPLLVHIDNRDGKEYHTLNVDYQTAVFPDQTEVEMLIDRLEFILEQIVTESAKGVGEIRIVPPKEYDRILYRFNDTHVEYPREKCIHELFMEQVEKTPMRTALVFEDKSFTYRELDLMSNSLAYLLREKGIGCGDVVPVISKRSWYVAVAILGVLKAGGAYMPVDPNYPEDRISYMLDTAGSRIALVYGHGGICGIETIRLDKIDFKVNTETVSNINTPENPAYIIFTSGSTGKPKGVTVCHRNVCNYANDNTFNSVFHKLNDSQCQSIVSVTNIIFDIFVTESLLPLINGLCIYFANDEEVVSQRKLRRLLMKNSIDVLQTTPTKMRSYLMDKGSTDYLKGLKAVILGGEAFPQELYHTLRSLTDAHIYNIYGPAETTVWSTNAIVKNADITIGTPIANTQIYILNRDQYPVPIGVPGELCIAGEGVGLGYLNQPELTAKRFVPNPFASEKNCHGKIMYHTGDLARFRSDGEIEYLGRMDTQVKIRGLRVELGEIENVMGSFPGVGLCAVADKRDVTGRQYLVGYYTTSKNTHGPKRTETAVGPDERALRAHLSAKLPKYMVPNYFMRLEAMPMTASGKTDRKNLPVPDLSQQAAEYAPPKTDTEKRLAEIWQRILQIEKVGRTDDFFALGGDSLPAISMLAEIEKTFHTEISVREIMEHSGLAALAQCLENGCETDGIAAIVGGPADNPAARNIIARHADRYRLLPQQKAVYAACMKEPDTLVYNMPTKIILPDTVDRDRLQKTITQVLNRHKLLRSCVRMEETGLSGVYDQEARIVFEKHEKEDAFIQPFDLEKAPLVRAGFTTDSLLFDVHHIIADGASMNILLREIAILYDGGRLAEPGMEYSDYAEHFYSLDMKEHKAYFQEALKCHRKPVLLPETKNPGTGGESRLYQIPKEVFSGTRKYARENGLTDTMVFLGAYGILLSKYTGQKEILSSIILLNRTHGDLKDMVGMFANTLPICLTPGNDNAPRNNHIPESSYTEKCGEMDDSVTAYMQKVKENLLGLFRYQELPFEDISEAVGMDDRSVVNTSFVYQGDGEKVLSLGGQEMLPQFMDTHTAKFDFSMELTPAGDGCRMRLEYNLAKYDGELMDALAEGYIRILGQLEKNKLSDIFVLPEKEYRKILEGFNDTYVENTSEKCVHELFAEQAAKTPEQTALIFENWEFSYKQLNEMSNSLAHFLRRKGVRRGDVVPVIAKRSWHVIVAMLGILKAGGAYMLVDYQYPAERILYLVQECNADIVLVYGCEYTDAIDLEDIEFTKDIGAIESINKQNDILCVIHTSGSTGVPKVTALSHENIASHIDYAENFFQGTKQTIATTTITFDAFIQETLVSLCRQVPIILLNEAQTTNQNMFENMVEKYKDSFLFQTPTKLQNYIRNSRTKKFLSQIASLIIGGEVFPQELYDAIRTYNPNGRIYNGYGPSETTVCVVANELKNGADITIGTPIANTQIYILDGDQRPVPIGVPGELYIAGKGVGLGYLNRPELTAQRFIQNPFATVENRHGKTMYRTGDLARFRQNGEIEYLGRMDTQVKIRGLRIELEEIESVMGSFPGVGLCAVADKRNATGRQYLVGYYTVATDSQGQIRTEDGREAGFRETDFEPVQNTTAGLDEKALRVHMSARLPKYMVPNYFMRLESIPMTVSGKTDRKNLPIPDFSQPAREYIPPVTEKEKELCHLMEERLHVKRLGVTDDFFELGCDSLTAIEFLARAQEKGISFTLQNIFDYPTVRQLCNHMDEGNDKKIHFEPGDFDKYRKLLEKNMIDKAFVPVRRSLGNVLLTGATGFLGAHVLDRLLQEETGNVYCLVRDREDGDGIQRLREILRYYFGDRYEAEFEEGSHDGPAAEKGTHKNSGAGPEPRHKNSRRIILISGDIESEVLANNMPENIQTVIHTAASVKHYGSYRYFHRVNVEGTGHVINYAKSVGARLIHISTLSVSGNSLADAFAVCHSKDKKHFDETSLYIGQPLDNVYIHSKFEAERAVFDAMLTGLDAKIIRVGNLTSRVSDYKFQPNYKENAFLTRFKAILEFGLFPDYLMSLYSEFSPIDLTAEGVVKIAQYANTQTVFHLNSNCPIYFTRFLEVLHELGIPMEVVDGNTFTRVLRGTIRDQGTEYIFEAFQNDMDEQGRLVYDSNIHIENDFTVWFLKKLGFEWNEIDKEYLRGYVEYFRGIGYLRQLSR